ncbi:hypothetical protein GCM10010406_46310 [Streptomyces thermolineatus]|uniref:F5/8 type C domain-containing protein n=1 Tax=Streptomyces thermolineatus TaxID=44033 RepID=A0ABN3MLV6_9ACTN
MGSPGFSADFSVDPVRVSGTEVGHHLCRFSGNRTGVAAGGSVTLDFEVADPRDVPQGRLTVEAYVSLFDSARGHAPVDVVFQGETLVSDFAVPCSKDTPQDSVLVVPGRLLERGTNTLEIRVSPEARSVFWLHRITFEAVPEQVRPELAPDEEDEAGRAAPVLAFDTEYRPAHASPATPWQRAPRLLFHIDRGEASLPVHLGWRRTDGAESAVDLRADGSGFEGCRRAADGTVYEYRGRPAGRWAFPEGLENTPAPALHRFRTQERRNDAWQDSPGLRLLLDDGGVPVDRVSWRDRRGDSATVMLHSVPAGAASGPEVVGVRASSEFRAAGETADKVLDDSLGTKWLTAGGSGHLVLTLARPTAVESYSLTSANDFPERDPRDWTLYGSDDGRTWTALDTRIGETFGRRHETREFHLRAKSPAYREYCLDIVRNSGAGETQLARVRLAGHSGTSFTGYRRRADEDPVGYRSAPALTATPPVPAPASVDGVSRTSAFRAFARQHGVSDDAVTRILWMVQPSVHLHLKNPRTVGPQDRVIGYVGGLPEMPLDAPWEIGHYFVASLDLAAIPKQPLDDDVPREGHLLLFAEEDYRFPQDEIAPVIHVPPGTETAVRPAPVYRYDGDEEDSVQEVLERQALVLECASGWDVLGWPLQEDGGGWEYDGLEGEERLYAEQFVAAVEEYRTRVGVRPAVDRRSAKLRGVELNPPYWRADYGIDFLRKREEAVVMLRNSPERFDELYGKALEEAQQQQKGGPWLNLVEFGEDSVFQEGDGEVGWIINRQDLLAGRFDRVRLSYHS